MNIKILISKSILILLFLLPINSYALDSLGSNIIVGKWTEIKERNECAETYEFTKGDIAYSYSGKQITESRYIISNNPTHKGFYKLRDEIIKDTGGNDCSGTNANLVGSVAKTFIYFKNNDLYICFSQSKSDCFGPLRKE